MAYHKALKANQIDKDQEKENQISLQHADRQLKKLKIINPFAPLIDLPKEVNKQRRTLPMFLNFIETITYYHQHQRKEEADPETGEVYIHTTIEDIEAAFELFKPILIRKSDELTEGERTFYESLQTWNKKRGENTFKSSDIREEIKLTPRSIERYLKQLTSYGKLKQIGGSKQKGYSYILKEDTEKLVQSIEVQINQTIKRIKKADTTDIKIKRSLKRTCRTRIIDSIKQTKKNTCFFKTDTKPTTP